MNGLVQNLRYSFRQLRQNAGFATVAVLTLTLGIGATTAIYTVLYGTLLAPMPYAHAGGRRNLWSDSVCGGTAKARDWSCAWHRVPDESTFLP
jgi:putative ABC transport system permease protein